VGRGGRLIVSDPSWLLDLFAAVMLAVSAYCAVRLVVVRRLHRTLHYGVNSAHVAMGLAMSGMLVPVLNAWPNPVWEALFAGFAVSFAFQSASFVARHGLTGLSRDHFHRVTHYLTHLVMSFAMLYMYLAAAPVPAHAAAMAMGPAPGTAAFVGLPLVFILVLCASAVWHVDALSRFTPAVVAAAVRAGAASRGGEVGAGPEARWLAPRLEMGCHIAMCAAMAFMLVLLL